MHAKLAALAIAAVLAGAPMALAQSVDCASALGQRVCANPDLTALEQERQGLVAELSGIDAAHPALAQEQSWLDVQQACADDGCLAAGYLEHNQVLRQIVEGLRTTNESEPLAELPTISTPAVREDNAGDEPGAREVNADPPFRWEDYLGAIIMLPLTFLIAFWLLGKAARARRGE